MEREKLMTCRCDIADKTFKTECASSLNCRSRSECTKRAVLSLIFTDSPKNFEIAVYRLVFHAVLLQACLVKKGSLYIYKKHRFISACAIRAR